MENPYPNVKPMKESELRAAAVCAKCRQKIGVRNGLLFYRVTVERHVIDYAAVNRKTELEMMLNSPALASVMGPDEDMTVPIMDRGTITICDLCAGEIVMVHELAELVNQSKK